MLACSAMVVALVTLMPGAETTPVALSSQPQPPRLDLQFLVHDVDASSVQIAAVTGRRRSFGAGVVVSRDGYVVTAYHLVAGHSQIWCRTGATPIQPSKVVQARIVGGDPAWDIAVVKMAVAEPVVYATFAAAEKITEGAEAVVIGNPSGSGQTLHLAKIGPSRLTQWDTYRHRLPTVQTLVHRGHSGGGVFAFDTFELLGIVIRRSAVHGDGFFVPADRVLDLISRSQEVRQALEVERAFSLLGCRGRRIALAEGTFDRGILITTVLPNGPAAQAGWAEGDVLVALGEYKVGNHDDLCYALEPAFAQPGPIRFVLRTGSAVQVDFLRPDRGGLPNTFLRQHPADEPAEELTGVAELALAFY